MRTGGAAIFIALFVVAAPAIGQTTPYALERYRVTLKGGGLGTYVDQTVIISIVMNEGRPERWIAERLRRGHNWCGKQINERCLPSNAVVHDWIDGHTCPALNDAFEDLAQLKLSGFAPPARSGTNVVTDTPLLTVSGTPDRMPGYGAYLSLAGFTGPVVEWWSRSEPRLAPCWTAKAPTSNGKPLDAQLAPN